MTPPAIRFTASIPVLLCANLDRSLAFYTDKLGFTCVWLDEDGRDYAALARDEAQLHLAAARPGGAQPSLQDQSTGEPADVNLTLTGIDQLWTALQANDTPGLMGPPADQDYGVRDFSVLDPDGYQIRFNEFIG